jgi:hypothetical protein
MAARSSGSGRERRWAGPFRVCPACGRRSFVGRTLCASCGASLREAPLPQAPGSAMATGRRTADRISGRPVWIGIAGAVVAAALIGFYVNRLFQTGGWSLPGSSPATAVPAPVARAAPEAAAEPDFPRVEDRAGYQKGRRLLAAGDARGALPPLTDAARALPNDAAVAHELGTALLQTGEEDRGLFHLERAARLAPGIASYRMDLARALATTGRRGPAARELEGILAGEPGHVEAGQLLATVRGRPPAAEAGEAAGGGVDMGGAAAADPPRPATGGVFTNDDLERRRGAPASPPPSSPPPPGR